MENELRFYLNLMKCQIRGLPDADRGIPAPDEVFKPTYFVTAVKLPTGAIELAVNVDNIADKIDYILDAYDDNMKLKTNPEVELQNMLIV